MSQDTLRKAFLEGNIEPIRAYIKIVLIICSSQDKIGQLPILNGKMSVRLYCV